MIFCSRSLSSPNALRDAGLSASELGKVLLVGGSTRIPAVQDKVKQLTGHEPSKTLNPDECGLINIRIREIRACRNRDMLLPAGAKILSGYIDNTVRINIKCNLNLRNTSSCRRNPIQTELSKALGDKLSDSDKSEVQANLTHLKELIEKTNPEVMSEGEVEDIRAASNPRPLHRQPVLHPARH